MSWYESNVNKKTVKTMENTKHLKANEGVKKLKGLVEAINVCLFSTFLKKNDGATCRPMSAQEVDSEGNVWFFSGIDSDKNREIKQDNLVQLVFSHPGKSSYMIVNGVAEISTDPKRIEELWTPVAKIWFKEGKDDSNISLIKVNTKSAYYWDTDVNKMINFFKFIASVATGSNLVTGVQGSIKV
jgi:general stress protein 26